MAAKRTIASTVRRARFDPITLDRAELYERLRFHPGIRSLPNDWLRGRLPRSPLPIDKCINKFLTTRKSILRSRQELSQQHPLGVCPYAFARQAVAEASFIAEYHDVQHERRKNIARALKYVKDNGPKLCTAIAKASKELSMVLRTSEYVDVRIPRLGDLVEALHASHALLAASRSDLIERT
jgi:hypothetical protein